MSIGRIDEFLAAVPSARLSRREVLMRATALGLSAPAIAALLAACGGDEAEDEPADEPTTIAGEPTETTPAGAAATSVATEAPEGSPTAAAASTTAPTETAESDEPTEVAAEQGGGGTLRILWWQAPVVLNGHLSVAGKDIGAIHICMEPLAHFDPNGELVPVLAAEIPSLDNGGVAEDYTSVTWKLRPDVKWHDGEDFTADDVAFTYTFLSDPASNATTLGFYRNIESVEAVDDHTVTITFTQPVAAWFNPFVGSSGTILPEHVLRDYVGADAVHAPFNLSPIGTGPFKVVDFRPGDTVLYEIN